MTDKGSYTLSSGEAAKAELRELREVAEEMAELLGVWLHDESEFPPPVAVDIVLARYEALRDG